MPSQTTHIRYAPASERSLALYIVGAAVAVSICEISPSILLDAAALAGGLTSIFLAGRETLLMRKARKACLRNRWLGDISVSLKTLMDHELQESAAECEYDRSLSIDLNFTPRTRNNKKAEVRFRIRGTEDDEKHAFGSFLVSKDGAFQATIRRHSTILSLDTVGRLVAASLSREAGYADTRRREAENEEDAAASYHTNMMDEAAALCDRIAGKNQSGDGIDPLEIYVRLASELRRLSDLLRSGGDVDGHIAGLFDVALPRLLATLREVEHAGRTREADGVLARVATAFFNLHPSLTQTGDPDNLHLLSAVTREIDFVATSRRQTLTR